MNLASVSIPPIEPLNVQVQPGLDVHFTPDEYKYICELCAQLAGAVAYEVANRAGAQMAARVVNELVERGVITQAVADGIAAGQNFTSEIIRDDAGRITHVRGQVT